MPRPGPRPAAGFDHALERGDLANAWMYAHDLPVIPLYKALWLTILIGDRQHPRYQAVCRRFMVRFIREVQPTMEQVKKVADALEVQQDDMQQPECQMAKRALWDLVEQLRGEQRGPRPRTG